MYDVLKYQLSTYFGNIDFHVPAGAVPLTVQIQDNFPVMWVKQPKDSSTQRLRVNIVPTGYEVITSESIYLATYQLNGLVYHVFYELYSTKEACMAKVPETSNFSNRTIYCVPIVK